MKTLLYVTAFILSYTTAAAQAQDRSAASAQAFIRESLGENAKAMLQPVGRGELPWGTITSVSSPSDCVTRIQYGESGTIVLDWSKVHNLGAHDVSSSSDLWVQGVRSFIVIIGGLGPSWERSRISTLSPGMNRRVADAMNYLKEECDQSTRHGF